MYPSACHGKRLRFQDEETREEKHLRASDGRHDAEGTIIRCLLHNLVREDGRDDDASAGERGSAADGGEDCRDERDLHSEMIWREFRDYGREDIVSTFYVAQPSCFVDPNNE